MKCIVSRLEHSFIWISSQLIGYVIFLSHVLVTGLYLETGSYRDS